MSEDADQRTHGGNPAPPPGPARRSQLWLFLALTGASYFWLCTDRSGKLFQEQDFGDVFDHLAISIVHGRLDLPPEVIGTEAFIIDGRHYGYWAPFPALLRIPLALTGSSFWVGHTARAMCWLAAMASVLAACGIVRELQRLFRWPAREGAFLAVFLGALAFGGHVPYLVSGPSTYHESILWGSATALAAMLLGLVFIRTRKFGMLLGAVLVAGLSALSRATTGYGALVGTSGLVAFYWWEARRHRPGTARGLATRRGILLAGLSAMFFFLPLWYNYARFGSFVRLPYNQHPGVEAWRVEITKRGNFQAVNLWPNALTYFDPTQIEIRPGFPYFHLAAYRAKPGAQIEHAEAYAGIPSFMTGLCVLAALGLQIVTWDRRLWFLLAGGAATLLALLTFTAVAHRYEHDLFPLVVLLSAGGALWLEQREGAVSRIARILVGILLLVGIWQSMAFAYFEQEWARGWSEQHPYRVRTVPPRHD